MVYVQFLVVALIALRLQEGALELLAHHRHFVGERVVPVVIVLAVAEGLVLDAFGLRAFAAVASGAAVGFRRVVPDQQLPAVRMRAEDGPDVEQIALLGLLEGSKRVLVGAGGCDAVL